MTDTTPETKPIRVDVVVLTEAKEEASKASHRVVSDTHSITWLHGEWKRLKAENAKLARRLAALQEAATPTAA